jgi:LPXTG-motif cell wall-anchored protein
LTVFTASIGILAMITGLYWMNVELPGQDNSYMFFVIVMIMIAILFGGLYLGKKKEWR